MKERKQRVKSRMREERLRLEKQSQKAKKIEVGAPRKFKGSSDKKLEIGKFKVERIKGTADISPEALIHNLVPVASSFGRRIYKYPSTYYHGTSKNTSTSSNIGFTAEATSLVEVESGSTTLLFPSPSMAAISCSLLSSSFASVTSPPWLKSSSPSRNEQKKKGTPSQELQQGILGKKFSNNKQMFLFFFFFFFSKRKVDHSIHSRICPPHSLN
jgi:hypothetical protein